MAESTPMTEPREDAATETQKLEPSLKSGGAHAPAAAAPKGFGATLKAAREAQGISLGDMAVQCRLAVTQLRALEEEQLDHLPEPVYVRAFIRSYARALHLADGDGLVADYMERFGTRGAAEVGQIPKRPPSSEAVFRESPKGRPLKIVLFVALAALVGGGIWAVYTDQFAALHTTSEAQQVEAGGEVRTEGTVAAAPAAEETKPAAEAPAKPAEPAPAPAPAAPAEPAPAPAPAPAPVPAAAEAKPAAEAARPAGVHRVEFRLGAGSSWVQVIAPNGRNVVAAEMKPQSAQTFDIPKGSRFTIGNAAVVMLTIDGEVYALDRLVRNGIARFTIE